jgi:hypothetical protein
MRLLRSPLAVVRLYLTGQNVRFKPLHVEKPQFKYCGDEGNRTPNPRLAKAVLCQLSYVP